MPAKLSRPFVLLTVASALSAFAACADDGKKSSPRSGTGGSSGGAGKAGSAGLGGTGAGTAGTAGGVTAGGGSGGATAGTAGGAGFAGTATSGTSGAAGAAGNAGTAGSAGASGTAGTAGTGGEEAGGQGGEGGAPGCPANPGTIYGGDASFDEPGTSAGWTFVAEPDNLGGLGDGYARRVASEGYLCPGALEVTIPFSAYGANEKASVEKASPVDWTGKTQLHAWVKIENPGNGTIAFINGIELFVESMGSTVYSSKFVGAAAFDDFEWHEIVLDLTAAPAVALADVNKVGVEVIATTSRPPSAPMRPSTTVVYVDDLYLE